MRLFLAALIWLNLITLVAARDDGRYANSPLKSWFEGLKSKKGMCCSFADGIHIEDVDWDVLNGHYRVRIDGAWVPVPDAAVIEEPNRLGTAVVWPTQGPDGLNIICFMPGSGT